MPPKDPPNGVKRVHYRTHRQLAAEMRAETAGTHLSYQRLKQLAESTARRHVRRMGRLLPQYVDADDLAQMALEVHLRAEERQEIVSDAAYLNQMVRRIAFKHAQDGVPEPTFRAWGRTLKRVAHLEQKLGRSLTQREKSTVYRRVLRDWEDPRHLPAKQYFVAARSTNRLAEPLEPDRVEDQPPPASCREGYWVTQALDSIEVGCPRMRTESRVLAVNALVELYVIRNGDEIPFIRPASVSGRQCTNARRAMRDEPESVLGALHSFDSGQISPRAKDALFLPWGKPTPATCANVSRMLLSHHQYAESLWRSALRYVDARRLQANPHCSYSHCSCKP